MPSPAASPPHRTRKRYAQRACMECQRRKRRCSGDNPCENCRHSHVECVYSPHRVAKKSLVVRSTDDAAALGDSEFSAIGLQNNNNRSDENMSRIPPDLARFQGISPQAQIRTSGDPRTDARDPIQDFEQRYEELRREITQLKRQISDDQAKVPSGRLPPTLPPLPNLPSLPSLPSAQTHTSPTVTTHVDHEPIRWVEAVEKSTPRIGGKSLFQQFDLLDNAVVRNLGTAGESMITQSDKSDSHSMDPAVPFVGPRDEIEQILEQTRTEDLEQLCRALDLYFSHVNTHWPYINEASTRSQFTVFLADEFEGVSKSTRIQFAALLNFIHAVTSVLYNEAAQDGAIPGWTEFLRGDKLLEYEQGKENIMKLQILLVKASYHFYASCFNAAHDTVSTAVRLCFQLGLHNEPSWGEDCTFYDRIYRQRYFWALYCLNHIVAQNTGVPTLINDDDFIVDLPKCVDDRMLYPGCPPLREMARSSPVPYFREVIGWTKLSSEAWKTLFGLRSKKPINAESISALDERAIDLERNMYQFLRWPPNSGSMITDDVPLLAWHQSLILYLRIRALRLVLRREEMVSLNYQERTAQTCINIATEIVAAIELIQSVRSSSTTSRYAWALHVTGAIIPVICVIVTSRNEGLVRPAIDLYYRALALMREVEPVLSFARRVLEQLARPIRISQEIISSQWPQYSRTDSGDNMELLDNGHISLGASMPNLRANLGYCLEPPSGLWNFQSNSMVDSISMPSQDQFIWEDFDMWNQTSNLHA